MTRFCFVGCLALLFCSMLSAAEGRPPNVILIFSDDQGSLDLNCYGSSDLSTPHLDALAARGLRFTQFYVASPVCSPSRAALLTGRNPIRAGVPSNVSSQPGARGMPPEELTIAELLNASEYRTALFGKWHLGTVPECSPNAQGFDEFFGHKAGCIDNYSHWFYWQGPHFHDLWRNGEEAREDGVHLTELLVRESQRFIKENKSRPFFLYLPYNLPHYPAQAPETFTKKYASIPEPRRSYAASISYMDDAIGRILATLDELKLREETLVIFLSDHGHSTEERAGFGGGNAGPFRGAKFSLLEGGIRVPCIVSWPGKFPAGEVRNQFGTSVDLLPTIAELCGVALPDRKLDGKSLVPVLKSAEAASPHERFHWRWQNQWAVREGDWKLVVNAADTKQGTRLEGKDKIFLSNLALDVSETRNIAAAHPEIVQRLTRSHEEWFAELEKSR